MMNVPTKTTPPFSRGTITKLNRVSTTALQRNTVLSLNKTTLQNNVGKADTRNNHSAQRTQSFFATPPVQRSSHPQHHRPILSNTLKRGQKYPLGIQRSQPQKIQLEFGWEQSSADFDVDISIFMLDSKNKVPNDNWLVFYGQMTSPDKSVRLEEYSSDDYKRIVSVDIAKISNLIQKIVFVITIYEGVEKQLNFSMVQNAYVKLVNGSSKQEMCSYVLGNSAPTVVSMTIGELYAHNNAWKFNPVGNGLLQDLAGQCAIYGVNLV